MDLQWDCKFKTIPIIDSTLTDANSSRRDKKTRRNKRLKILTRQEILARQEILTGGYCLH